MGALSTIKLRLRKFQKEMDECLRVNLRNHENCQVIAVTKRHPLSVVMDAYSNGIRHFGESQVQEGVIKVKAAPEDTVWHFIGHLQKNKVRKAIQHFHYIHSVDSMDLLDRMTRIADDERVTPKVFLQVNLLEIPGRFGFFPEDVRAVLECRADYQRLDIVGLMGIKPLEASVGKLDYFQLLRNTRDHLKMEFPDWPGLLSSGMSGDFKEAIAMGSNFLRIGTRILGERD